MKLCFYQGMKFEIGSGQESFRSTRHEDFAQCLASIVEALLIGIWSKPRHEASEVFQLKENDVSMVDE